MLQAWGWRTSSRTPSSRLAGAARIKCNTARHALLASEDAVPRELAPTGTTARIPPGVDKPSVPEKPIAGPITPHKLARLSDLLRLPVIRVETILQGSPASVRHLEPEHIAQRLEELCSTLGINAKQAAFLVTKQPEYMLLTPLVDMRTKVQELAEALGVPPAAVIRTALTAPSILRRSTAFIVRRVKSYSALLRCSPLDVLHVLARGPEYLTDTPSSVRQRMTALGYVLRRPRCTVAEMLQAQPDLVFMSGKVMNTKVNGLMCILNKQKRHVVTLVVKLPALLRCNLDCVRNAFDGLQALLGKRPGFVYAMVCHAPSLLLLTPRSLHQRCTALRRCLSASPELCEQFGQLRPPGVARLVLNRRGSLSAVMYLVQRRRAGSVPLAQLLSAGSEGGPAAALGDAWPDFAEWMDRRQHLATLRNRQQRGARWQPGLQRKPGGQQLQQPEEQQSDEEQQQELQQQQQPQGLSQHRQLESVLASVGPVASSLPASGAATGSCLTVGGLLHYTQPGFRQTALLHVRSPHQSADDVPAFDEGCTSSSSSSRDSDGSCSSMNGSNGSMLGVGYERGRITQQDGGEGLKAERCQQTEASTSGRQPSWLQLQAEYRRSLRLRAPRNGCGVLQQGHGGQQEAGLTPSEPEGSQLAKRLRSRHRHGPWAGMAAGTVSGAGDGAAGGDPLGSKGRTSDGTQPVLLQAARHISGIALPSGVPSLRSQPRPSLASVGSPSGEAGLELEQQDPTTASSDATEHSFASSPSDTVFHLPASADETAERHRHAPSGLLQAGRRQQPDTGPAAASPGSSQWSTHAETHPEQKLSGTGPADASRESSAHTIRLGATLGGLSPQHAGHEGDGGAAVDEVAAGGGALSDRVVETWRMGTTCGDVDVRPGSSHRHAVESEGRSIPVWLRLGAAVGTPSHGNGGDGGGYVPPERGRQPQGEPHSSGRAGDAPAVDSPQHGTADEVLVVSGDGSMRDIKGLGRESHVRSLRGQDPGGALAGQSQKLESALEAIVPR